MRRVVRWHKATLTASVIGLNEAPSLNRRNMTEIDILTRILGIISNFLIFVTPERFENLGVLLENLERHRF